MINKKHSLENKVLNMESVTSIRIKTEIYEIVICKRRFDYVVDLYYNNYLEDSYIDSEFFPLTMEGFTSMIDHVLTYIDSDEFKYI